jgi:hypothetical protein
MNHKTELLKLAAFAKLPDHVVATLQPEDRKLYRRLKLKLASDKKVPITLHSPRLVNGFTIGADPEFVLADKRNGTLVRADSLDLKTSTAYGADGSGRPVELRAAPSRMAVEVVGSILNTLRTFVAHVPASKECNWLTGGWQCGQSIGGHVHFGRRYCWYRLAEVHALDASVNLLDKAGLFGGERQARAKQSQNYGFLSDYRKQVYGYEYRTFPSWLHSPQTAHLVLTISKLAVQDMQCWRGPQPATQSEAISRIYNILSAYRYLDDDAALARQAFHRTFQPENTKDVSFRRRWGLEDGVLHELAARAPKLVFADADAIQEVTDCLATGAIPKFRIPKIEPPAPIIGSDVPQPTMRVRFDRPLLLPINWRYAVPSNGNPEYNELWMDAVTIRGFKLKMVCRSDYNKVYVDPLLVAAANSRDWERAMSRIITRGVNVIMTCTETIPVGGHALILPWMVSQAQLRAFRTEFVESGLLPFAPASKATLNMAEMWRVRLREVSDSFKLNSSIGIREE